MSGKIARSPMPCPIRIWSKQRMTSIKAKQHNTNKKPNSNKKAQKGASRPRDKVHLHGVAFMSCSSFALIQKYLSFHFPPLISLKRNLIQSQTFCK